MYLAVFCYVFQVDIVGTIESSTGTDPVAVTLLQGKLPIANLECGKWVKIMRLSQAVIFFLTWNYAAWKSCCGILQKNTRAAPLHCPFHFTVWWKPCSVTIRDFKQTTTATSTTAAGSKHAQNWRSAHAWKWLFAVAPNPTTWRPVFCRSHYYVGIKST